MAGIDINGTFPNSKMAGAARLGQSLFRTIDTAVAGLMTVQAEEPQKEPEKKPAARK